MPSFGTTGINPQVMETLRNAGVLDQNNRWVTQNVASYAPPPVRRSAPPQPAPSWFDEMHTYSEPVSDEISYGIDDDDFESYVSGNVEANSGMQTIAQLVGHRASYPTIEKHPLIVGTNLAGVEIELEGITARTPRFNYWTAKGDGSLRNRGMEFVCSSPWGGRDLYNAAIEIDGWLFSTQPEDTWRCSTHVHVDVRDMTVPQLKRMILAYAVYERILFKCSGFHRYKNNFCVALGFAQELITTLSNAWGRPDSTFINTLVNSWDKYSSINLLPIQQFGSVEFRISEAKWRKGRLIRLVNRFLSLKEIAMQPFEGSESDFITMLVNTPMQKILRKGLPKVIPDYEMDIEMGYKLAHDIISMAALRRRGVRSFVPNLDDESRQFEVEMFEPGWEHIRNRVNRASDTLQLEMERDAPATINFSWLYELENICVNQGITFERSWFVSRQNNNQIQSLYGQYFDARRRQEREERRASRSDEEESPVEW